MFRLWNQQVQSLAERRERGSAGEGKQVQVRCEDLGGKGKRALNATGP